MRAMMGTVAMDGARIKFITDGDVAAAVMAATPDSGVALLRGIGSCPRDHGSD